MHTGVCINLYAVWCMVTDHQYALWCVAKSNYNHHIDTIMVPPPPPNGRITPGGPIANGYIALIRSRIP